MEKLFGTDGIRGIANEGILEPENLVRVGKAITSFFRRQNYGIKKIVIGKDTRLSGYLLETALTSGIVSMGVDVLLVGPMPTPAIAHLTRSLNADAGIVLSASHNPAKDNGVKIFGSNGLKLDAKSEAEIEKILHKNSFSRKNGKIGKAFRIDDARGRYIEFVKASISSDSLEGLKIVVDCANGSAYSLAERIFSELGAEVVCVNNRPNGSNINQKCGALFPQVICSLVKKHRSDAGLAFDGDADRVVFCDEKGKTLAGEQVMAVFSIDLKKSGGLKNNSVVVTKITNSGFAQAMKRQGIKVIECDVGDKNVVETMIKHECVFGAEPSGHIIFSKSSTTGDGLIAALKFLKILKAGSKPLSVLKKTVKLFPQKTISVKIKEKKPFEKLVLVNQKLSEAKKALAGKGRIVLRYSGTEMAARIMVEAKTAGLAGKTASLVALAVKKEIGA